MCYFYFQFLTQNQPMKKIKSLFLKLSLYAFYFLASMLLCYAFTFCYRLRENVDIKKYEKKLISLGRKSIPSGDVPVACLLVYHDSIIGEGFNDVRLNNNPSGHAEINAIKNCFEKIGYLKFKTLDKTQLTLLTTYEPCTMCKGAIEEYDIRNVIFGLNKNTTDKIYNLKKDLIYYKNLRQTTNKRLQYNLFKECPTFDSIQSPI